MDHYKRRQKYEIKILHRKKQTKNGFFANAKFCTQNVTMKRRNEQTTTNDDLNC